MTVHVNQQFWDSQRADSFFQNQVVTRVTALSLTVLMPLENAIQYVGGACLGLLSILSGGGNEKLNSRAMKLLNESIVSNFFQCASHAMNPYAKGTDKNKTSLSLGSWSSLVGSKFDTWASHERGQTGFFRSAVNSRLLNAVRFPVVAAVRVIDNAVGLVAGVGSIATFGKVPQLYSMAAEGLSASKVVQDLYVSLIRMVNPDAKLDSELPESPKR